jgi:uncharacterized membrane protein YadS
MISITAKKEEGDQPRKMVRAMMIKWIVIHLLSTTKANSVLSTKKKSSLRLMPFLISVSLITMAAQALKMVEDRLVRMRAKLLNLRLILQRR